MQRNFSLEDNNQKDAIVRQALILVGGKGTRLGEATRDIPKPLMAIESEVAFLDILIEETARQGFDDIILLAGHFAAQITDRYRAGTHAGAKIRIVVEDEPRGTAGALLCATEHLAPRFLMMNGDSLLDFNLRAFAHEFQNSGVAAMMALRHVSDASRFGLVQLDGKNVTRITEKDQNHAGPGLINAGIYGFNREITDWIDIVPCSLETNILPRLSAAGTLNGMVGSGYFIDIGIPKSLAIARQELPVIRRRPAAFLDRDGVINVDVNYAHQIDQLEFVKGAPAAIRRLNDAGYRVVVVTNQAGVAHGLYNEEAIHHFHAEMQNRLFSLGAFVDRFYYCPFHPNGKVSAYRRDHPDRKPEPGMILRALADLPIDKERSFLIGDKDSDLKAAERAGIPGFLFAGSNLDHTIASLLPNLPPRQLL